MTNTSQNEPRDISVLSAAEVTSMSYNEIIGLVRETNRLPGGRRSIAHIAQRICLRGDSNVLEIGCATGATSIDLNRLTRCRNTAVDINAASVAEARRRAAEVGAEVDFKVADATQLPFANETFDAVICGNVTALIDNKEAAIKEYQRVMRQGAFLVAAPLYYIETPHDDLVDQVRAAIQVNIPVLYRNEANQFYEGLGLEVYDSSHFTFEDVSKERVERFCDDILARSHLVALSAPAKAALDEIYREYMELFRVNMQHLGFSIIYLRKTEFIEDPELFLSRPV